MPTEPYEQSTASVAVVVCADAVTISTGDEHGTGRILCDDLSQLRPR